MADTPESTTDQVHDSSGCVFKDLNVPCQNPACTICVQQATPEMVAAGVRALLSCDTRVDGPESVVEAVWEAMEAQRAAR